MKKLRKSVNNFDRSPSHRRAMMDNMLRSLIKHESITTGLVRAKFLKRIIEKMVTRARVDNLHNRRLVMSQLQSWALVKKLFENIAPRYLTRPGGYLRIIKKGVRLSDSAKMAIIEFVEEKPGGSAVAAPKTDSTNAAKPPLPKVAPVKSDTTKNTKKAEKKADKPVKEKKAKKSDDKSKPNKSAKKAK